MADAAGSPKVKGFVRYAKVSGKHRMYCYVRERKVVLGKGCKDGQVAYFHPNATPPGNDSAWKCLDANDVATEATELELYEKAGKPQGTLEIVPDGSGFNVVNTATGKRINTYTLTKDEAEEIVKGSPEVEEKVEVEKEPVKEVQEPLKKKKKKKKKDKGENEEKKEDKDDADETVECPMGHKFGEDHDNHDECDECSLAEDCKAAMAKETDE